MRSLQPLDVVPMETTDCSRAGEILGRAFLRDPIWVAVLGDPDRRPESLRRVFAALARATIAARGIAEKTSNMEAIALWFPPGTDIGPMAVVRSGFALPRFVMGLPSDERRRMMTVRRQFGDRRKAVMPSPHWYLAAIGVDPGSQGLGLGSALVRRGIERAENDNAPIYLETDTEGNVGFYEHLGFDVIEEFTPPGLDVPIWLMIRDTTP